MVKVAKKFGEDKLVGGVEETTTAMATSCIYLKELNSTTATDRLQDCSLQRVVVSSTPQAGRENKSSGSNKLRSKVKKQNSPHSPSHQTNSCIFRGQTKQRCRSNSSSLSSNVGDEFEISVVKPEKYCGSASCSLSPYCSQSCCCHDHCCFTSDSDSDSAAAVVATSKGTTTNNAVNTVVFVDLEEKARASANNVPVKPTKNSGKNDRIGIRKAMLVSGCEANRIQKAHHERFGYSLRSRSSSDTDKQRLKGKEEKEGGEEDDDEVEGECQKFKLNLLELQLKSPHRKQQKHYNYKLAFVAKTSNETPKFSKRVPELFQMLVCLLTLAVLANSFLVAECVDCFKCSSRNGSNPACEDPFHNLNTTKVTSPFIPDPAPLVIYHSPCYAGKKGREGLFPASACIKLTGVFDTTGETLVVRHCALDSGTLTQDTELARMSHCGKFQFEGDLLKGCVLACPEDACNSAPSNRVLSKETLIFLILAQATIMAFHLLPFSRGSFAVRVTNSPPV